MLQLDAEGYREVNNIMDRIGPSVGGNRLAVYTRIKEVVAFGCSKETQEEETDCAARCGQLACQLICEILDEVRESTGKLVTPVTVTHGTDANLDTGFPVQPTPLPGLSSVFGMETAGRPANHVTSRLMGH